MTYEPDQFSKIVDHLEVCPEWLILGGPADANEAQTATRHFPDIRVIAVEPLPSNILWQRDNGFPSNGILIQAALGEVCGPAKMFLSSDPENGHRNSSLDTIHEQYSTEVMDIEVVTIDSLEVDYGPFNNALLWLDIEGYEYQALKGAEGLLRQGKIRWVNVEAAIRSPEISKSIFLLLSSYGFTDSVVWNVREGFYDQLYLRRVL